MNKELKMAKEYILKAFGTVTSKAMWMPADAQLPVDQLPKVKGVVFEVTDACNSRCQSCNIWQTKTTKDLLKLDEIERIFSDRLFDELESIIITGGEPVLRKDIKEILLSICKKRPTAQISLSTNGLLPERVLDSVQAVLDEGGNLVVGVSVDAIGKDHDAIRGVPGNFEKVDYLLKKLSLLREKDPCKLTVIVGQTFSPLTIEYIEEVREYALKMQALYLPQLYEEFPYYSNTEDTFDGLEVPRHIEGTAGHHLSNKLLGLSAYKQDPISILEKLPPSFQDEIMIKAIKTNRPIMHSSRYRRNFCASMNTFFLLRANGDIAPCLQWSSLSMGNIRNTSPSKVWGSQSAGEGRKLVRECSGCSNTWATSWSAQYWFPPFTGLFLKTFIKKKIKSGFGKTS